MFNKKAIMLITFGLCNQLTVFLSDQMRYKQIHIKPWFWLWYPSCFVQHETCFVFSKNQIFWFAKFLSGKINFVQSENFLIVRKLIAFRCQSQNFFDTREIFELRIKKWWGEKRPNAKRSKNKKMVGKGI